MAPTSDYKAFLDDWRQHGTAWTEEYTSRQSSFIPGLMPEQAVQMPVGLSLSILEKRLGTRALEQCLDPNTHWPSPVAGAQSAQWLKRANLVGINVRTIGNFWNVVKYTFTLPASQNAIHLLPIWEPGVVSSLYGIASWNINPEFFSHELYESHPHLDTVERQLLACVNVLHALGKAVGMDVIPHTDRYSEIVLANPHYFEWLLRKGDQILDHSNNLHEKVQDAILDFLKKRGSHGREYPVQRAVFFGDAFGEAERLAVLFGQLRDYGQRSSRRAVLMDQLFRLGLEPVPATMAPPYRGLVTDPVSRTVDDEGREWMDYTIANPTSMSRVFGPLTRFKFYENKNNNRDWEIDFTQPKKEVWAYFTEAYARIAREYGFDFMRGDMSHVQMRAEGVPALPDEYYDPLRAVRRRIQEDLPHFGYFAESFLGPAGYLAYGDEVDHLEAAQADSTLGDLQSMVVGSPEFLQNFRWYLDILNTRRFAPSFTLMTGDKDDPRFDKFYLGGNEARFFIALFLPDMPSYMGLGFECRDAHPTPAPNEHYTKLYVFKISEGPKATHGPYVWGKNAALFSNLLKIRIFAETFLPQIENSQVRWLLPPDPTGHKKIIAWTLHENPGLLFVVNLDWDQDAANVKLPCPPDWTEATGWNLLFSIHDSNCKSLIFNGENWHLSNIGAGNGLVFSR